MSKVTIVNRWNGTIICEGEMELRELILTHIRNGGSLQNANLQYANLQNADLQNADLHSADLRGANLDFASWPLWCGSLTAIIDDRLKAQLLYHCISVIGVDKFDDKQIEFANTFHRIGEVEKLTK